MRLDFVESPGSISFNAASSAVTVQAKLRTVAIVGYGNSAHALGAYLAQQGHRISYLTRSEKGSSEISGAISAYGAFESSFTPQDVAWDWEPVVRYSDTIFVATTALDYPDVARRLSPFVREDQTIILFSSKLGGVLEFKKVLQENGAQTCSVIETDALFACRLQEGSKIWVRGVKKWNLYTGCCPQSTYSCGERLLEFFPDLEPATNFVHRGLTDFGALTHSLNMIINMNAVDRGEEYSFYYDGFTRKTIKLLEQMETEFNLVANAYGCSLIPAKELLNRYYGTSTRSLYDALTSVPNYKFSKAPVTLDHRYIIEDVGCTLTPLKQLAELAGVKTALIDSIICMAGILTGYDFEKDGRTLERLGLGGRSYDEVYRLVNKGSSS